MKNQKRTQKIEVKLKMDKGGGHEPKRPVRPTRWR
jgi:hypothetical protein